VFVYLLTGLVSFNYSYRTSSSDFHFTPTIIAAFVVLGIIAFFIQNLVRMGKTQLTLKAHSNAQDLSWWDLWRPHPFWRFFGGTFLVGIITFGGFILLVVPGIVWAITYMFVPYLIIDHDLKPFEALKESRRITVGNRWNLFVFCLALIGINILGFLCLIVGLLVSVPVSAIATVHAYRVLQKKVDGPPVPVPAAVA